MKDTYVEYLLGIYTLIVNDLIFLQMLHQNTTASYEGYIMSATLSHCPKYVGGGELLYQKM